MFSKHFELGFTKQDLVRSVWGFIGGFVVAFGAGAFDILAKLSDSCKAGQCDWSTAKTAGVGLAFGTGSAIFFGLKNLVLKDGSPFKG
jgi:hypothetical protein